MTDIPKDHNLDELVRFKVRKRVVNKVIKDIHHQEDNIELQIQFENIASLILLPFLFIFMLIITSILIPVPDSLRQLSGLIG